MAVIDRFCDLYRDLGILEPDQLHALYDEDVVFQDPLTTHTGIESLKTYFSKLLEHTESCKFDIENIAHCEGNPNQIDCVITWTMSLVISKRPTPITLTGVTLLRICNDRITYHRDYYDVGEMVYEHVPVLGWLIRKIKQRLAK